MDNTHCRRSVGRIVKRITFVKTALGGRSAQVLSRGSFQPFALAALPMLLLGQFENCPASTLRRFHSSSFGGWSIVRFFSGSSSQPNKIKLVQLIQAVATTVAAGRTLDVRCVCLHEHVCVSLPASIHVLRGRPRHSGWLRQISTCLR